MKKLVITILLVSTFFLYGCNKMSNSEIFEKNLECQKYLNGFIEKTNSEWREIDGGSGTNSRFGVFYSPKENSCIGYYQHYRIITGPGGLRTNIEYRTEGLLGSTKKSSYDYDSLGHGNPFEKDNYECQSESDFRGKYLEYECDNNDTLERLRLEEIEWLKKK